MALTVDQIGNTSAAVFDIRHRYFAGPNFNTLTLTNYTESGTPTGWTISGDTVTPALGWTEITPRVYARGSWLQEWRNSTISWTANLSGHTYDSTYLGVGKAILCLEQIEVHGYRLITDINPGPFIYLNNASDWPVAGGTGHIDGDNFSYTGVFLGATLIGVAGLNGYHYTNEPCARTYNWRLAWIGVVESTPWLDNYHHGAEWNVVVRSSEATLERVGSPRVRLGSIDIIENASVTVSSTLSQPEVEEPSGEFAGTAVAVSPEHIVDGRLDTVWISEDAPTNTGETTATSGPTLTIDEVFFSPITGWSNKNTWWIELLCRADNTDLGGRYLFTLNQDDQISVLLFPPVGSGGKSLVLNNNDRCIICASQHIFEAYTGGSRKAALVIETAAIGTWRILTQENRTVHTITNPPDPTYYFVDVLSSTAEAFNLNPTAGWVGIVAHSIVDQGTRPVKWSGLNQSADVVKWTTGPTVTLPQEFSDHWLTADPVNVTDLVPGQSIRRSPSGNDATGIGLDWKIEPYPRPGDKWEPNTPQWAKIELQEHTTTLENEAFTYDTTLVVDDTTGWPAPPPGSTYQGKIENEIFAYKSLTNTVITLADGTSLTTGHVRGVKLYPYSAGEAQTGWPIRAVDIERRFGRSTISKGRIYISQYAGVRDYDQTDFAVDYYPDSPQQFGGSTVYRAEWLGTTQDTPGFRWVRTIMIVIDAMSDNGRAKINRVKAYLPHVAINNSGLADISPATPAAVLEDILADNSWLTTGDIIDNTIYTLPSGDTAFYNQIGEASMAIAPFPRVLDDVARSHGLLVRYGLDGKVYFDRDPWWVNGTPGDDGILLGLIAQYIRGDLNYTVENTIATGLALNAQLPDGTSIPRVLAYGGARTGAGIVEYSDYVVQSEQAAQWLANTLWLKETRSDRISLTIKGLGEWCRCGQRFWIAWDLNNDGTVEDLTGGRTPWICEKVTRNWSLVGDRHDWTVTLDLRQFAGI